MALLNHTIDESNLKSGDDTLPPGNYVVEIVSADMVENSKKTGYMIVVVYRVTEGSKGGSFVTDRFNYKHKNETAQRIGRAQFDKMLDAAGFKSVNDTDELISGKLAIRVENKSDSFVNDQGTTINTVRNDIKKYLRVDAPVTNEPSAAPAASNSTPWS